MGIFDFFKQRSNDADEKLNENQEMMLNGKEQISEENVHRPGEKGPYTISYYDENGKKQKMLKEEWVTNVLKPAIENNWRDADGLYTIILDSFSKKIYDEVKTACLRLYAVDENDERKVNILGLFYVKTKDYEEAEKVYKRYISSETPSEVIFTNYAKLLEKQNRINEAERNYINALTVNINSPTAFENFFNIVKKRSLEEYNQKLELYAKTEGAWKAKLKLAMESFKIGNKAKGDYYLVGALKESNNNSEVMAMASGIYGANRLFDDFRKTILPVFNPEKQGVYTTINVLEYYKLQGDYKKGLELCKFISKFAWMDFKETFKQYENDFIQIKRLKTERADTGKEKEEYFTITKPIWYYTFNKPEWLLNNMDRKRPNILVFPFTALDSESENNKDKKTKMEDLALAVPAFFNEVLHYNSTLNYLFALLHKKDKIKISSTKYTKEFMEFVKTQNNTLDYILTGNISVVEEKSYDIIEGVEEKGYEEEPKETKFEIEVYLYDCSSERKVTLINKVYNESDVYKIQYEAIEMINEFFGLKKDFQLMDKDNAHLFLYAKRLKLLLKDEKEKENLPWEYKELLSEQIKTVLEDEENDFKKIELVDLMYEVSLTNSQLLKNEKPVIYNMINQGFFEGNMIKLLLPVIFNIYKDEENYGKYLEFIRNEIEFGRHPIYVEWVNRFLDYVN